MNCPRCSSTLMEGEIVCPRCGHMMPDGRTSTTHLKVDPKILRLRRVRRNAREAINGTLVLRIRGMMEQIPLDRVSHMTVGRSDIDSGTHADLDLSRYGASDRGVSRLHVELDFDGAELHIRDLGSANGTLLNGERLVPNDDYIIRDGDELLLGQLSIGISSLADQPGQVGQRS